jgi:hypothetical protein
MHLLMLRKLLIWLIGMLGFSLQVVTLFSLTSQLSMLHYLLTWHKNMWP